MNFLLQFERFITTASTIFLNFFPSRILIVAGETLGTNVSPAKLPLIFRFNLELYTTMWSLRRLPSFVSRRPQRPQRRRSRRQYWARISPVIDRYRDTLTAHNGVSYPKVSLLSHRRRVARRGAARRGPARPVAARRCFGPCLDWATYIDGRRQEFLIMTTL